MAGYRRDIDAARRRLADCERRILRDARFGDIEYTEWGEGPPMILSHPLFGGFDMMTGFAGTYIGSGHRFVAPSRFGYLGSSLPPAAMPAGQADAYALLLDTLGIDRTAVFGYSGGGPSAIQFAFRHAERTTALILMASALPGKAGAPPKALAQALFGSDRLFWMLKSYAPSLFARILGMPKDFRPTPGERERIEQTMDSLFPIHPRKRGVLFDLYVSNPDVQTYPLEEISVPRSSSTRKTTACQHSAMLPRPLDGSGDRSWWRSTEGGICCWELRAASRRRSRRSKRPRLDALSGARRAESSPGRPHQALPHIYAKLASVTVQRRASGSRRSFSEK